MAFGVEGLISMVLSGVMKRLGCKDVVSKTIHQSHGRSDASWCHIMPLLLLLLNQFGLAKIEGICKMVRSCEHIGQEMNYTSSDGQKDIQ